ncbi:SGNH/GDSL hydrolase family protein [Tautonia marina]|uniref:SGNH/GDSL hydrolase family protein n=1 Tax=Tautonia marina TaxID=2653855 RepID=UPI00126047C8|nr:SGNH/GDSL hydrolase family protein [Tautonia marina]
MPHVVLLGDSIFDNAAYVPGGPSVLDHLRKHLLPSWRATLLAVDGSVTEDVARQLKELPRDATHLVVSTGGNDALGARSWILHEPAESVAGVLTALDGIREAFQATYRTMLDQLRSFHRPVAVCTIYDAIPGLSPAERAGLALFNETILREASRAIVSVIDLRLACNDPDDFSPLSPIEPSAFGGSKIARLIRRVVAEQDVSNLAARIYR